MNMYEQFKTNMAAAFAARHYVACASFRIVYMSKFDFLDNIIYFIAMSNTWTLLYVFLVFEIYSCFG